MLPCTQMTSEDLSQLFDMFATERDLSDYSSSGEDSSIAYDDFYRSAEEVKNYIGPLEILKIWNLFQSNVRRLHTTQHQGMFFLCRTKWEKNCLLGTRGYWEVQKPVRLRHYVYLLRGHIAVQKHYRA